MTAIPYVVPVSGDEEWSLSADGTRFAPSQTAGLPSDSDAPPQDALRSSQLGEEERLQLEVEGFRLAGVRTASLREVNGGPSCVGPWGREPPGYELRAPGLGPQQCALLAHEQPDALGFRWGRVGFDREAYLRYAQAPHIQGSAPEAAEVALQELFGDVQQAFTCLVYVARSSNGSSSTRWDSSQELLNGIEGELMDSRSHPPEFRQTNITRQLLNSLFSADGAGEQEVPKPVVSPGVGLCGQRWDVLDLLDVSVAEMWFCYVAVAAWSNCEAGAREVWNQGLAFLVPTLLLLLYLSHLMRDQAQFGWALRWAARAMLNFELGLACCALLLRLGLDQREGAIGFGAYALGMIVAGGNVLQIPHAFCMYCECRTFGTFYLMVIVFSPCALVESMSYYPAFPLLVEHRPMLLGLLGFAVEVIKEMACCGGAAACRDACYGSKMFRRLAWTSSDYKYTPMAQEDPFDVGNDHE